MTKEVKTEININAHPEIVWSILTNLEAYRKWNPFITKMEGQLIEGEKLKIVIQPPNASKMSFNPTILELQEPLILKWKGTFIVPGLFDGTHSFELIDNDNGTTTFRHNEIFAGLLVRFFNLKNTHKGFVQMNLELKKRCESEVRNEVKFSSF